MNEEKCHIEIFRDGTWQSAATLTSSEPERGHESRSRFSYKLEYVNENLNNPDAAIACAYPVTYDDHSLDSWPAFMIDLLPGGAGREALARRHNIPSPNHPRSDWLILKHGAGASPGNLRITEAVKTREPITHYSHPGFTKDEVIQNAPDFIEYAEEHGAIVSGSSDVQGDAPKFLVTEDTKGRWHIDGALLDSRAKRHWLVKMPRGKKESDSLILKNEFAYYAVANELGVNTYFHPSAKMDYSNNVLFIPRFDREIINNEVTRYGLESVYSLCDVSGFGVRLSHNKVIEALEKYCSDPFKNVIEYIKRDIINVAMGNTDNHGRNTAVLKKNNIIELSPLFDFAPMFFDPDGIARAFKWDNDFESLGSVINYGSIIDSLRFNNEERGQAKKEILSLSEKIERLPDIMVKHGVDDVITNDLSGKRKQTIENISTVKKKDNTVAPISSTSTSGLKV